MARWRATHQAWLDGGGQAEFTSFPAVGEDGHAAITQDMQSWLPVVDSFLIKLGFDRPAIVSRPAASHGARIDHQLAADGLIDHAGAENFEFIDHVLCDGVEGVRYLMGWTLGFPVRPDKPIMNRFNYNHLEQRSLSMDLLRSLEYFHKTVELGSFSGAANALGLTPAAVSKQIGELEKALGSRVF